MCSPRVTDSVSFWTAQPRLEGPTPLTIQFQEPLRLRRRRKTTKVHHVSKCKTLKPHSDVMRSDIAENCYYVMKLNCGLMLVINVRVNVNIYVLMLPYSVFTN